MRCNSKKADGNKCKAYAMHDSKYCFRHDHKRKAEAMRASSSGGKAKRQYHVLGDEVELKTPADIKELMEKAINSLWTGKMPANNPAGSLGYLAKIFLEAHDKSELEKRVDELEQRLNSMT